MRFALLLRRGLATLEAIRHRILITAFTIALAEGLVQLEQIDEALGGNICRCTGYVQIRAAIEDVADATAGHTSFNAIPLGGLR